MLPAPRPTGLGPLQGLAATLLGVGRSRIMPGTCGSLLATVPCLFLPDPVYPWAVIAGVVLATLGSVMLARRLGDTQDPGWFVLDEAAGVWVALLHVRNPGLLHILAVLVLFRVFDIWKPPPIKALESVGGGWGIVLDDLMAGTYALGLVLGASFLFN